MNEAGAFDRPQFEAIWRKRGLRLGHPLVVVDVTGSTNDDALRAAHDGAPHGALFVADAQQRGRGRRGRSWSSPPGENLLLSLVLRPGLSAERAIPLTLVVGLAVREVAARQVTEPIAVKWPNDVVSGPFKLAGILVEAQLAGGELGAAIVGVGFNVATRELPVELRDSATSLALLGAGNVAREPLLVDLLAAVEQRLDVFSTSGLESMLPEWRRHDALRGRRVRVGGVSGIASGIDAGGALLVTDATGRVHRVTSGTVELD